MRRLTLFFCVTLLFLACEEQSSKSKVIVSDTTVEIDSSEMLGMADGATAQNSLDVAGVYKGILPCADCEGMETTIELKKDSTYSRIIQYLGKKENRFTASGKWIWINGSTISLGSIKEEPNQYFVAEGKLIQLDMAGNRITGELAATYELKKQ
jgi:uncharacterized lipoprotein NlpE involved in copper resistance